jgi:hypothetical protein
MQFSAAQAFWNQRVVLAELRSRLLTFSSVVNDPASLSLAQYAQLTAAALEFRPDLILELGRGWAIPRARLLKLRTELVLGYLALTSIPIGTSTQLPDCVRRDSMIGGLYL